jgi:hypothetical protein
MKIDIAIDKDGNFVKANPSRTEARMTLVSGSSRMRQLVEQSLLMHFGEWFLDRDAGVDYQGVILKKSVSESAIQTNVSRVLDGIKGVRGHEVKSVSIEDRGVTMAIDVVTLSGTISIEVNNAV